LLKEASTLDKVLRGEANKVLATNIDLAKSLLELARQIRIKRDEARNIRTSTFSLEADTYGIQFGFRIDEPDKVPQKAIILPTDIPNTANQHLTEHQRTGIRRRATELIDNLNQNTELFDPQREHIIATQVRELKTPPKNDTFNPDFKFARKLVRAHYKRLRSPIEFGHDPERLIQQVQRQLDNLIEWLLYEDSQTETPHLIGLEPRLGKDLKRPPLPSLSMKE